MRVQRVLMPEGSESWTVLGPTGEPVGPVELFLAHLQALDRSPTTLRTYATTLKLWMQFLDRLGVAVDGRQWTTSRGSWRGCDPRPITLRCWRAVPAGAARPR